MSMKKSKEKLALVTSKVDEENFREITMVDDAVIFNGDFSQSLGKKLHQELGVELTLMDDFTVHGSTRLDDVDVTFNLY